MVQTSIQKYISKDHDGMRIVIDHRESEDFKSFALDILPNATLEVLDVGDIVVDEKICFEHKQPTDFISSLFDGRLFRQIHEMQDNYQYFYIIVSGNIKDIININPEKYDHIIGAISSCFVRGCPVIFVDNYVIMFDLIKKLSSKLTDGKLRTKPIQKSSVKDEKLRLICSLPGISEKIGRELLKRFKSPYSVLTADVHGLIKVNGIGKKTAKKIVEIVRSPLE